MAFFVGAVWTSAASFKLNAACTIIELGWVQCLAYSVNASLVNLFNDSRVDIRLNKYFSAAQMHLKRKQGLKSFL